jgi:hypothetical protein
MKTLKGKRMIISNKLKSNISKGERNLINITLGKKKSKTEKDEKLRKEIEEIKKKGGGVHIPHD